MSADTGIIDEGPQAEQPSPQEAASPQESAEAPQEPAEDDHPEAVADAAGQRFVPLSALQAVRGENKALKPLADRAQQLEAWANDVRPYVEFLKNNPQLLQPQQHAQPQAPQAPQTDPQLVSLAKKFELYDPQTGQPDVAKAAEIRDMWRQEARQEAAQLVQAEIGPVRERTHEQQAAAHLQGIMATKDADGRPLAQAYVAQAVRTITDSLPRAEALRVLADPKVADLLRLTALGMQASQKKSGTPAPVTPALHVETAGGGSGYVMTEESRKLARLSGISEKDYAEKAKQYRPGQSNVLE